MHQESVHPDMFIWSGLLATCDALGWEGSLKLLASAGPSASTVVYNTAMKTMSLGHWPLAMDMATSMSLSSVQPDTTTFNTALLAQAKQGRWQHAIEMLLQSRCVAEIPADIVSVTLGMSYEAISWEQHRHGQEAHGKVLAV